MGTFGVKRASDDYFCPSTVLLAEILKGYSLGECFKSECLECCKLIIDHCLLLRQELGSQIHFEEYYRLQYHSSR